MLSPNSHLEQFEKASGGNKTKRKHAKKWRSLNFSMNLSERLVKGNSHRLHSVNATCKSRIVFALPAGVQVMSLKQC